MNFNKLYQNFFTRQNVGRQLITLFFCIILIPIFIISLAVYIFSIRQLTRNYANLTESKASQVRSVLVTTTLSLHNTYETIANDEALTKLISAEYKDSKEAFTAFNEYQKFNEILANTTSLTDLKLYVEEDILRQGTNYNHFYPITEEIRNEDWYQYSNTTYGNFWKSTIRTGQGGMQYWNLSYYCRIILPKADTSVYLVMTVSNNHLRNLIQPGEFEMYISVNEDPVFISSNRSYEGGTFPIKQDTSVPFYSETGQMKVLDETVMSSLQTFRPYSANDQIKILVTNPKALPYIRNVAIGFILIELSAIAIAALLIFLYARYFSARIQTLRLAMHKLSHNDYEIVNNIQGDDELTETFQDLKKMVIKQKETEAQIYESQIKEQILSNQQQQMELKLLANQINPHFLYNTLEMIRMKAFSNGDKDVAQAIKLLGKTMRYVLNNTKTSATTLDKEIDYISNYLAIQKLRFEERLDYSIRIDEKLDLKLYQILPLLIQPIVENAISHGLANTESNGHIIIKLYKSRSGLLVAEIFDNGTGMTQEQLEYVITHLDVPQNESEHGVGLYNINNRIRLFYGAQYGLTIKSRPCLGTLVTLTIPLLNLTEEEE